MSENMPEVLISEEEIHAKVEELARRISADRPPAAAWSAATMMVNPKSV